MGPLINVDFRETITQGRDTNADSKLKFQFAYDRALQFADDPNGWFVLSGASGSGKTHLAAAIANRVMGNGSAVFFVFVPDLLDHLRHTYTPDTDISYDRLFYQVRDAPLLVLDDLGGHTATPWAQEKLYQVLNYRYAARLATIITHSIDLHDMDYRWQTRLSDPDLVTRCDLGGNDVVNNKWGMVEPQLQNRMNFANFDTNGKKANSSQKQSLEAAYQMALHFAADPEGWLVFMGPRGCGKTHLATSITNERISAGDDVRYFLVSDLLDRLRESFGPDSTISYYRLFEQVRNTNLLVLRGLDFGMTHVTPWAKEKLNQLLIHRYDARLPTVITTSELNEGSKSDPIMSRLQDITLVSIVPIDAPDYRHHGRDLPT